MADPDWIGAPVEEAWWGWDGRNVYYTMKREGADVREIVALDLAASGQPGRQQVLDGVSRAGIDGPQPVFNGDRTQMAFIRHGDVFVRDLTSGHLRQLTRIEGAASGLRWSSDGTRLLWMSAQDWFGWDAEEGIVSKIVSLRAEDAPDTPPKADLLRQTQLRLFDTLRTQRERREARRAQELRWRREDPTRSPPPVHMGKDVRIITSALSPDGRWLLVVTEPKSAETGRAGQMPRHLTGSSYEETEL